jgi:hypothetical protein
MFHCRDAPTQRDILRCIRVEGKELRQLLLLELNIYHVRSYQVS